LRFLSFLKIPSTSVSPFLAKIFSRQFLVKNNIDFFHFCFNFIYTKISSRAYVFVDFHVFEKTRPDFLMEKIFFSGGREEKLLQK
jgi:hypothetical protein